MTFAGVLCKNTLRHGLVVLYLHTFVCECLFVVCHVQILDWLSWFGSLLLIVLCILFLFIWITSCFVIWRALLMQKCFFLL